MGFICSIYTVFYNGSFSDKNQAINIVKKKWRKISPWGICTAEIGITRSNINCSGPFRTVASGEEFVLRPLFTSRSESSLVFVFQSILTRSCSFFTFCWDRIQHTFFLSLHANVLLMLPGFLRDDWWWLKSRRITDFLWLEHIFRTWIS